MKLVEINWTPSSKQLRQFGLLCLVALPLIGWLWTKDGTVVFWLVGLGFGLALVGLVLPNALKPLFIGLMLIAFPIGLVVSELVMLLIYFGVFLPIGLCFKLMKRDALKRSIIPESETYWERKNAPKDASRYYRQW